MTNKSPRRSTLAALIAAVLVVTVPSPPATASAPAGATGGDGTDQNPFTFEVDVDCSNLPTSDVTVFSQATVGLFYKLTITISNGFFCLSGSGDPGSGFRFVQDDQTGLTTSSSVEGQFTAGMDSGINAADRVYFRVGRGPDSSSLTFWMITNADAGTPDPDDDGDETPSVVGDPTASTVAVAVEQAVAAGVAGSSSAVLIRRDEVVPVTSRITSSVGPRGGVVLEAEGLRVAVASATGARTDSGVIVAPSGDVEVSIRGGLVPGAVVEAWVNSSPRLVAAAQVPADHQDGDVLTFTVPFGAPLDGGEPIESGAHTLQLRMYTDAGFEVLATGVSVGGIVPTAVPAGGGPVRLDAVLIALLGAAGLAGFAVRRAVVSG